VLSVRLPAGTRTARGLPLGLSLSRALGEFVVGAVLGAARSAGGVYGTAMVDDIVLLAHDPADLARAWAAAGRAAASAGLALHQGKSGAAALGEPALPDELPTGAVRWGLLRLEAGRWRVDDAAVAAFAALTRARVEAHGALLDRVAAWREQLRYAWTWLAPVADLGPDHLRGVGDAVARVCDGLAASLRAQDAARFLDGAPSSLPDAWLHWPLSAGGLGAPYPPADIVPLLLASERRTRVALPAPADDPSSDRAWGAWFADRLAMLAPEAPAETPAMAALEKHFVERGQRVGRAARPLAAYWRWVLHTLGPDVLEAYGTFDFVATDLIPLELIRRGGAGD
jgi:hypothetical protein